MTRKYLIVFAIALVVVAGFLLAQAFAPASAHTRSLLIYFYDANKDKDAAGNVMCSRQSLTAVKRTVPITKTPIQNAVNLLLTSVPSDQEKAEGLKTQYPLSGVTLKAASLRDGQLTLTFDDPQNKTGGGSCRVSILWAQIEATAKQFPEVSTVSFMPPDLFQP